MTKPKAKPEPQPGAAPLPPAQPGVAMKDGKPVVNVSPGQARAVSGSTHQDFAFWLMKGALGNRWNPNWLGAEEDRQQLAAMIQALRGFAPRDEMEGMIAAQAISAHAACMECYRRAMLPDQPGEAATQLRKQAANLSRTFMELVAALDKRRGKGTPQVFRVERVQVAPGGQAIVGNVAAGAGATAQPAPPAPDPAHTASGPPVLTAPQPDLAPPLDLARPEPVPARAQRQGGVRA